MVNAGLIKKLSAIYEKTIIYMAYIACVLLVLITMAECVEIIVRKFGNTSLPWVIEFSEYALVFIAFLAGAWVLKKEAHIKVDLVLNMFTPRTRAVINVVNSILGAVLCLFLTNQSAFMVWDLFKRQILTAKTMEIPIWPLFAVFCFGNFLLTIQFFIRAHGYFKKIKQSHNTAEQE